MDKDTVSRLEKEEKDRLKESTVTLIEKSELTEEGEKEEAKKQDQVKDSSSTSPYGFIIHSFSDGGAGNQSSFLHKTNSKQTTLFPLLRAQIFDCSVGRTSPSSGSTAFSLPLLKKSKFLFHITKSFLYVFIALVLFVKRVTGKETNSAIMRRSLNNLLNYHSVLKNSSKPVARNELSLLKLPPRCYLYSKNDMLIDFKAVEEHANDLAAEKGLTAPLLIEMEKREKESMKKEEVEREDESYARGNLELRRWETPSHIDIGRADEANYWRAVDEFLAKAL